MKFKMRLPFTSNMPGIIREDLVIGLTNLGKTKAEQFSLQGPKWEVLAMLNEAGPSSISEISDELKMSDKKVKKIVKSLIASGYVKRVSGD